MSLLKLQIEYWRTSADENWKTALVLSQNKRYDACLFFCHLAIEKKLKGLVIIKAKESAPMIHNLEKLARIAELKITDDQLEKLQLITLFNIAGRYDDEKLAFYKKCTKKYTEENLKICEEIFLWLKKLYPKN
ncbi:MAG: HEPN domain-containing protein [Candidatus Falkowbacteria bacterium]|nr:HEPN domain-containing protein [Candidatus Falkowbacteria bacterium]